MKVNPLTIYQDRNNTIDHFVVFVRMSNCKYIILQSWQRSFTLKEWLEHADFNRALEN